MTVNSKPSAGEEIIIQSQTQLGDQKLIATDSFDRFLEDLSNLSSEVESLKLSDVFSRGSSSSEGADSMALLSFISNKKHRVKELNDRTIETGDTALTTYGDEFITGLNTAAAVVTLNDFPADGEEVFIWRGDALITVMGDINGGTSLTIGAKYSSPHLRYLAAAGVWGIV